MSRAAPTFVHVDMDAFFASVEILERPDLKDKPVVVGGTGGRGVVASCNYEARKYGIRSAMPGMRAKALCPHAVFLSGRYNDYEKYSALMMEILRSFTPVVEPISIDEAFLDIEGAQRLFGSPLEIAIAIRKRIQDELKLNACVGAATTKHMAKLASEAAKPKVTRQSIEIGSGVKVIEDHESIDFLHALPVRALWGIGPVTATKLERLQVSTVGQLAMATRPALEAAVGKHSAQHLHNLAWNLDERELQTERAAKSIGHEQTFPEDLRARAEIHERVVRLADAVASRLRKGQVGGRTINTKVRFGDFRTITRASTLPEPTASTTALVAAATKAIDSLDLSPGVRLIGISVSNLEDLVVLEQLTLGDGQDETGEAPQDARLDQIIDEIRSRYGAAAVVPALLVRDGEARILRPGERQWGPDARDEG